MTAGSRAGRATGSGLAPAAAVDDGLGMVAALWRGVDVFRAFSVVYAVASFAMSHEQYRRPGLAMGVLAGMAVWTAYLWVRRSRPDGLVVTDLGVSLLAVLSTRFVDDVERVGAGASTLPLTWPAASVLAFAVWKGWPGGVLAALLVGVADVLVVDPVNARTIHNIVLLLLAGAVVGYACDLYRRSQRALTAALRADAATRERERLARDIHDSVLQVLAYVQRRGAELGQDAADLGRLAGEQEARLRALVSSAPAADRAGEVDVGRLLGEQAAGAVEIARPAEPVLLPHTSAQALAAAVGAALDNVRRHAGADARAWVLVEQDDAGVLVTVRDDGVGIPAGRLEEAEQQGRLGVASSVRGRLREVGGTVEVTSAPGLGTEVEMRLPRRPLS